MKAVLPRCGGKEGSTSQKFLWWRSGHCQRLAQESRSSIQDVQDWFINLGAWNFWGAHWSCNVVVPKLLPGKLINNVEKDLRANVWPVDLQVCLCYHCVRTWFTHACGLRQGLCGYTYWNLSARRPTLMLNPPWYGTSSCKTWSATFITWWTSGIASFWLILM